jgi:hypothetical protein
MIVSNDLVGPANDQPPVSVDDPAVVLRPTERPSRIDDKAAALEDATEGLKAEFRRERFVYIFVILCLFDGLIAAHGNTMTFCFFLIASLILSIGLAKWLQFPWMVTDLDLWLKRLGDLWDRRFGGAKSGNETIEP